MARQLTLDLPDYPSHDRYSGFDRDFIDLMLKLGVPERLGATAFALLVYIVRTEDARRFSDAPSFWMCSLADRVGIHRNNFKKHLQACVDSGWLFWHKDGDRETGCAWVMVPAKYQSMLKCSRSFGAEVVQQNVAQDEDVQRNVARNVARTSARTSARTVAPSSLIPIPDPSPTPSCEKAEEVEGWNDVERVMINEFRIMETSEPLRRLKEHGVEPSLALGVLRFASETKAWSPGKVRRRLISLLPDHDPRDRRLWMQPDHGPAHPTVKGPEIAKMQQRDERLRQLQFDFESEVRDLTIPQILDKFELPAPVSDRLRPYPTWKQIRDPGIRFAVLEAIAAIKRSQSA